MTELSADDRRRIYEEEKSRIEAEEMGALRRRVYEEEKARLEAEAVRASLPSNEDADSAIAKYARPGLAGPDDIARTESGISKGLAAPKKPEKSHRIQVILFLGGICIAIALAVSLKDRNDPKSTVGLADEVAGYAARIAELEGMVTLAEFSSLQTGMSYEQAVTTIGAEGTESSRVDVAGILTVAYSWQNPDGSNMNAMFQNGRLISKAQFGLR